MGSSVKFSTCDIMPVPRKFQTGEQFTVWILVSGVGDAQSVRKLHYAHDKVNCKAKG